MTFEASVPGNLLLAGEYAVLESGGLGIAAAVERRVTVRVSSAAGLEIVGSWGGNPVSWRRGAEAQSPLFDAVVRSACADRPEPRARIEVDSSPFFDVSGRKLGYGSSAAVAVGVSAALLRAIEGAPPSLEHVFRVSLAAHRAFQGGRGSGYDVASSLHGGTGLFRGGELPEWLPRELSWLAGALVFHGARPIATSGATARYRAWREREPAAAREFLARSGAAVLSLLEARTRALEAILELRNVALRLGEAIGVSSAMLPPDELRKLGGIWKALGAGNEIGVFLADNPDAVPLEAGAEAGGVEPLVVATTGLTWAV
jgi:phosphomevalonate kinase